MREIVYGISVYRSRYCQNIDSIAISLNAFMVTRDPFSDFTANLSRTVDLGSDLPGVADILLDGRTV